MLETIGYRSAPERWYSAQELRRRVNHGFMNIFPHYRSRWEVLFGWTGFTLIGRATDAFLGNMFPFGMPLGRALIGFEVEDDQFPLWVAAALDAAYRSLRGSRKKVR